MAVVGVVRRDDGFVSAAPNLGWRDVPLGQALTAAFGAAVPIVVANEADLGALAEQRRGAAAGAEDVIFLSGEVGLGGGLIVGGRPLTGIAGFGGEVGHMPVNPVSGSTCRCGSIGCWETEVGEPALLARAGWPVDGGRAAVEGVLAQAATGDATALAALGRCRALARASDSPGSSTCSTRARVVLGGHLASLHRFVAATIEATSSTSAHSARRVRSSTIVPATLGVDAAVLGAAELAFESLLADPASWFQRPVAADRARGSSRSPNKGGYTAHEQAHAVPSAARATHRGSETHMHGTSIGRARDGRGTGPGRRVR